MLRHHADAENHGQNEGGSGEAGELALVSQGVEEGIGGGVVGLPWLADRGADRGGQDEEVEIVRGETGVEGLGAADFRGKGTLELFGCHVGAEHAVLRGVLLDQSGTEG